jgi:hypothetical protein
LSTRHNRTRAQKRAYDQLNLWPQTGQSSCDKGQLLHGQEREVFGDQAYWSQSHRQGALPRGIRYRINRRPNPGRP